MFGKLGKLFARKEEPENERVINVGFVLLSKPQPPDAAAVTRAFAVLTNNSQTLRIRESSETILLFDLGDDDDAMVALMPTPVPNREADEAAAFSVSSLGTGWTLPAHEAHLVVTLQSETSPLDSLLTFTSLLAAVAESSPAVGVYCGDAGATHDPKFFIDVARENCVESDIMVWNGVSVAKQPDGRTSLLSLGMKQLDLPDLWLIAPAEMNPLMMFFNLLQYVVDRGEPIPDGDTIGPTEDQKIPVRYVPSPIDPTVQVWRIEIE